MSDTALLLPSDVLHDETHRAVSLPVCDHYCGVEKRIRKALALQREMLDEYGEALFDVTLDCEDGAPAGAEAAHAAMVVELAREALQQDARARIAVRIHPADHPAHASDIATIAPHVGASLCHVMLPKVETLEEVERTLAALDAACPARPLPLHVLLESPLGIAHALQFAAHPRVQSISFGLMDFVSAHQGAIDASAMTMEGQFSHPQVVRAKLTLAAACHAYGKTPSHCVVTEFRNSAAIQAAARRAAREFAYTRMWSIHPDQIRPILAAFRPEADEIATAAEILLAAQQAHWAPIRHRDTLHDRASYRYYWHVLQRARHTGATIPTPAQTLFAPAPANGNTAPR